MPSNTILVAYIPSCREPCLWFFSHFFFVTLVVNIHSLGVWCFVSCCCCCIKAIMVIVVGVIAYICHTLLHSHMPNRAIFIILHSLFSMKWLMNFAWISWFFAQEMKMKWISFPFWFFFFSILILLYLLLFVWLLPWFTGNFSQSTFSFSSTLWQHVCVWVRVSVFLSLSLCLSLSNVFMSACVHVYVCKNLPFLWLWYA